MKTSLLQQRIRQFLVHSFLYYELGETVISDQAYDAICQEIPALLKENQETFPPYHDLIQKLGAEASGYSIKNYPPEIISAAIHLLYQENYASHSPFTEFVERLGYQFQLFTEQSK